MKDSSARFYWQHIQNVTTVLDLGCGPGDLGKYKPPSTKVFGLEINPALVSLAKNYEISQVWDLDTPQPLPFDQGFFDAVVAKDILEHLTKPWLTLAEVRRVLKPQGIVLASVICERGRRVWSDYTHVRGFTMQSVRQMFTDAGLDVLEVWRMGPIPLASRLNLTWMVPYALRFPLFDWLWTSSYEIMARKRH